MQAKPACIAARRPEHVKVRQRVVVAAGSYLQCRIGFLELHVSGAGPMTRGGGYTGSQTALKFSFIVVGKKLLDLGPGGFIL